MNTELLEALNILEKEKEMCIRDSRRADSRSEIYENYNCGKWRRADSVTD